jgi:hypothetical protein
VGRKGDWRGSVTHTVKHINLHGSQAPASRAAAFASHLDKLRDKAVKGGGDKRIDVQHSKGKLTARERLEVFETPPLFVFFPPNWFACRGPRLFLSMAVKSTLGFFLSLVLRCLLLRLPSLSPCAFDPSPLHPATSSAGTANLTSPFDERY